MASITVEAPGSGPSPSPTQAASPPRRRARGKDWAPGQRGKSYEGWVFVMPALVVLTVFLIVPVLVSLWVSFHDWKGLNEISNATPVGFDHYRDLIIESGTTRRGFMESIRNNLYYVIGVVPLQTIISFSLALVVNRKLLKGKSFFRTAYYFPSVTSSIAVSLIFLFLFQGNGAVNAILGVVLRDDINWLNNGNGLIHNALSLVGIDRPGWMVDNEILDVSLWEWIAGPSVTMFSIMLLATWTTTGTFMLMFLAGLQNVPVELEEAAVVDGATPWQAFRNVTIPSMRSTIYLVVTLGVIGTWQVFDQIYMFNGPGGRPSAEGTLNTPAFLVYRNGFQVNMGQGSAIAFLLFLLIMVATLMQRMVMRRTKLG
jgi:multiple sugar transport system permease protein